MRRPYATLLKKLPALRLLTSSKRILANVTGSGLAGASKTSPV
jgi:hypothetical protein